MFHGTYPLVLTNLAGTCCVVAGGGKVAERKVAGLLEAGARPLVISPTLTSALAGWVAAGRVEHLAQCYSGEVLDGAFLVIAATDDAEVNARVAADAQQRGILVNVADNPVLGNFHTVASVRRGDLLLTVSTNGKSPTFAAQLRSELAGRYGPEYASALAAAATIRRLPQDIRNTVVAWLCSAEALEWLRAGRDDLVGATLERLSAGTSVVEAGL